MDRLDALERLARLRQQGMLSEEEFAVEKAALLAGHAAAPTARYVDANPPLTAHSDRPAREPSWHTDIAHDESDPFEPLADDARGRAIWPMVAGALAIVAAVIGGGVWFGRSEVASDETPRRTARKPAAAAALPALSPEEAQRQAFVAAFGYEPPSTKSPSDRESDDDDDLFSPVALIPVGSHLAVVAVHQGPTYHAAAGALAVRYVDRTAAGFRRLAANEVRVESGSFGDIGGWKLRRDLAADPVIAVEGGGTWQGCTGSWTGLIALAPSGPTLLAKSIPTALDHEGVEAGVDESVDEGGDGRADASGGRFEATLSRSGDDILVRYSGDEDRTVRYRREGDRLVPDSEPPPSC